MRTELASTHPADDPITPLTPVAELPELLADEKASDAEAQDDDAADDADEVPDAPATPVSRAGDVWAIGAHAARETTPDECREMMIYIKKTLADLAHISAKEMPRIIYGGSVNELNGHEFTAAGADGLLPGRLSLDPRKMQKLMQSLQVVVLKK
jgi:hypothetical protein